MYTEQMAADNTIRAFERRKRQIRNRLMLIGIILVLLIWLFGQFCFYLGRAETMKYVLAHPICGEGK